MADWPASSRQFNAPGVIWPISANCLLSAQIQIERSGAASATYPAVNRAYYIPFIITGFYTAYQIQWQNGTTVSNASNDIDVGLYNEVGQRLVSQGGTITQTPISVMQAADITDTPLVPGLYFVAIAASNTNGHFLRVSDAIGSGHVYNGYQLQATALPLPATATFASPTTSAASYVPMVGVALNATV